MARYTEIQATVLAHGRSAVLLEHDGAEEWIPHSLIEGLVSDEEIGAQVDVEVADWKLRELGWD